MSGALNLASLPRLTETQRTAELRDVLVMKLRTALHRVGCGDGAREGQWSAKDINALSKFWRHTKTEVATYEPTTDALEAVTARTERVCPLECEGDKVDSDGKCAQKPSKKRQVDVKRPAPADVGRQRSDAPVRREGVTSGDGSVKKRKFCVAGGTPWCVYE